MRSVFPIVVYGLLTKKLKKTLSSFHNELM